MSYQHPPVVSLSVARRLRSVKINLPHEWEWAVTKSGTGNLFGSVTPTGSVRIKRDSYSLDEVERVPTYTDEELRKTLYILIPNGWSAPSNLRAKTPLDMMAEKIIYLIKHDLT